MKLLKYRYLYDGELTIPDPWIPIINDMFKSIDYIIRPSFIPLWYYNLLYDLSKNKYFSFLEFLLFDIKKGLFIEDIKQKFASLRIKGDFKCFTFLVDNATAECNNTCEFCGTHNTDKVTIKSWIRNLCISCQEKYKNNDLNLRNSSSN